MLLNASVNGEKCSKSGATAWISAPKVAQKCGSKDEQSMKWQKCANPRCGFVLHSNPAVSKSYCCVMSQNSKHDQETGMGKGASDAAYGDRVLQMPSAMSFPKAAYHNIFLNGSPHSNNTYNMHTHR